MLIDTHAHLDYPDFTADFPAVLARAREAGVTRLISIGTRLDSSASAVRLAHEYLNIWATVGIHPTEVDETLADDYIDQLRLLAQAPRVAAIGEIGLDYHYLPEDVSLHAGIKTLQARRFREQLDLAVELGLNVVLHQRDSWDDCVAILKEYTGRVRGVFHCFGGTLEQAQEVIALGHLVSFTGIITFKNAKVVQETAERLPMGQFMVETDCPYLAPVPHRGGRAEPAHTRLVAERIAFLKGVPLAEIAEATSRTAEGFFRLG
jgi:TatD DNase family protein